MNETAAVTALFGAWWVGAGVVCGMYLIRLKRLSGTRFLQWIIGLVLCSAVHKFFWWLHLEIGDAGGRFGDAALMPLSVAACVFSLLAVREAKNALPPFGGLAHHVDWITLVLMLAVAVVSYWQFL